MLQLLKSGTVMKTSLLILCFLCAAPVYSAGGKCTGSASCRACKNCDHCKYCSKEGGSCGVCSKTTIPKKKERK